MAVMKRNPSDGSRQERCWKIAATKGKKSNNGSRRLHWQSTFSIYFGRKATCNFKIWWQAQALFHIYIFFKKTCVGCWNWFHGTVATVHSSVGLVDVMKRWLTCAAYRKKALSMTLDKSWKQWRARMARRGIHTQFLAKKALQMSIWVVVRQFPHTITFPVLALSLRRKTIEGLPMRPYDD